MTLSAQLTQLFNYERIENAKHGLQVVLATTIDEVRAAQRLRYRVFVEEMGARLDLAEPGVEADHFDPYCQHLLVKTSNTNEVVGYYRLLTDTQARAAGGYYSETEFDLGPILSQSGRIAEIGRACVHPAYRNGAVITLLWNGIARFINAYEIDYIMGCASIPLVTGTHEASMIYERLWKTHPAPADWQVVPKTPLPNIQLTGAETPAEIPPLLKAYLRMGMRLCGAPAWDPDFNVADLFIMLRTADMTRRYSRHFLRRT
jgi:putative hemolysin